MNINFVINNPSFFLSHRRDLGLAARRFFTHVRVYSPETDPNSIVTIQQLGIAHCATPDFHRGLNLIQLIFTFWSSVKVACLKKDDIFHLVTIKAIIIYGLPLRLLNRNVVFAISGMGTVFSSHSAKFRLLSKLILKLYRFLFNGKNSRVIVQNRDDLNTLKKVGVQLGHITLIKGSGVPEGKYPFKPRKVMSLCPKILVPARLIKEKGISEICQASRVIDKRGIKHRIAVAGDIDPGNPLSLTDEDIKLLSQTYPSVSFLGHVTPIQGLLYECDIVCLPSYREGLPKALIEAFAVGRPVVTYDTIGCNEIVKNLYNGVSVKLKSIIELAEGIIKIIQDEELRNRLIINAHKDYLAEMTTDIVVQKHLNIYQDLASIDSR